MAIEVLHWLKENGIEHEFLEHKSDVRSPEDAARERNLDIRQITKCMLCYNKNKDVLCFLLPGNKNLDFRKARKALGERKMTFISPDILKEKYGLTIGAISPIQMIGTASFYADITVAENVELAISSGKFGSGVKLLAADLMRILNAEVLDLGQ